MRIRRCAPAEDLFGSSCVRPYPLPFCRRSHLPTCNAAHSTGGGLYGPGGVGMRRRPALSPSRHGGVLAFLTDEGEHLAAQRIELRRGRDLDGTRPRNADVDALLDAAGPGRHDAD